MTIQPIQTRYGDRVYRSRTEARWAVALSLSRIPFEYEPETYRLPSGLYLPDFWLPTQKVFLEIKGIEPEPREVKLAIELHEHTGHEVWFGVGSPDPSHEHQEVLTHVNGERWGMRFDALTPAARSAALNERFGTHDAPPAPQETPRPKKGKWWW